jgi:hypothetical protein
MKKEAERSLSHFLSLSLSLSDRRPILHSLACLAGRCALSRSFVLAGLCLNYKRSERKWEQKEKEYTLGRLILGLVEHQRGVSLLLRNCS